MDISPISQPSPSPSKQPDVSRKTEEAAEAARQFEGLLLRQFVEEAFKPMFGQAMVGAAGRDVYQYFMTDALAKNLAQTHSFGISNLVQLQLTGAGDDASPSSAKDTSSHGI